MPSSEYNSWDNPNDLIGWLYLDNYLYEDINPDVHRSEEFQKIVSIDLGKEHTIVYIMVPYYKEP